MRILGIDFGERRIGLALSDPTGTIASPLPTLARRAGKRPPIKALAEIAAEHNVEAIVMGLPLSLAGDETEWCGEIRRVGALLADRTGITVHYIDERMTSVQAERAVRSLGLPKKERERKERIDAAAAMLILQRYLDASGDTIQENPRP
jgi:putative Holliday junction resolvase